MSTVCYNHIKFRPLYKKKQKKALNSASKDVIRSPKPARSSSKLDVNCGYQHIDREASWQCITTTSYLVRLRFENVFGVSSAREVISKKSASQELSTSVMSFWRLAKWGQLLCSPGRISASKRNKNLTLNKTKCPYAQWRWGLWSSWVNTASAS